MVLKEWMLRPTWAVMLSAVFEGFPGRLNSASQKIRSDKPCNQPSCEMPFVVMSMLPHLKVSFLSVYGNGWWTVYQLVIQSPQ